MNFIKGDLISLALQGNFNVIAHGANAQNIMGAGIAKQLAAKFPDLLEVDKFYRKDNHLNPHMMLGNYSEFIYSYGENDPRRLHILNLYTQLYPGLPSPSCSIPFDYEAFALVLRKVNHKFVGQSIGLPYIGTGLGKANKEMVVAIIEAELKHMDVTLIEYEDNKITSGYMARAGLGDAPEDRKRITSRRERERGNFPLAEGYGGGSRDWEKFDREGADL